LAKSPLQTGIPLCRFNDGDKWTEIVIDDRLPTLNGKIQYARSSNDQEFWICLIEKAYAK
jgi:hypothetical protein